MESFSIEHPPDQTGKAARPPIQPKTTPPLELNGINRQNHLEDSSVPNRPAGVPSAQVGTAQISSPPFGSSISKTSRSQPASSSSFRKDEKRIGFGSFIKPATPGAFKSATHNRVVHKSPFLPDARPRGEWPAWLSDGRPNPGLSSGVTVLKVNEAAKPASDGDDPNGEVFDLSTADLKPEDYVKHDGDVDRHMRDLLAGAIGDGENDDDQLDGSNEIDGFAEHVILMPHQVRGVAWMRKREKARSTGGILADDMGLGKTVQALARIVEGLPTLSEKKSGYKGTLIICPLAVMEQWATEIRTKTEEGKLKVTTHHGPTRSREVAKRLEKFDVVITTFSTLASEFGAKEKTSNRRDRDSGSGSDTDSLAVRTSRTTRRSKAPAAALFQVKWLRIIVDEAQSIKNKNTKQAKAACALEAKYRWCLTGTPIQNNVEELFSLFKFLRTRPLNSWEVFKEQVVTPMKEGRTKVAMKRLHVLLKTIMLRRTKDATIEGKPILNLPGRSIEIISCPFDAEERAFYDALETKTSLSFNKFLKAGTAMANYTSVLTLLLRLRQACDHPVLVTKSLTVDAEALGDISPGGTLPSAQEPDAADALADMLGELEVAKEKACQGCFGKLPTDKGTLCPDCAKAQHPDQGDDELPPSSAKIRMLINILQNIDTDSARKEKTIVFSQFTSFLDLIEPFLHHHGIAFVRYDGKMRNEKRLESLNTIKDSTSIRVILISFKSGSTGLNLTCCNHVILLDLWWNPALEDQAFDRAHRLGQTRDVRIYKLTIEDTVEKRILALQDSKREIARAALSGEGAKNVMKLTMADLMNLFKRDTSPQQQDYDDTDDEDD